ncbi:MULTISPECIES: helix-turn-helix domain-containing protein [unclassified Exiguobacterium]|uniref:helix-turn-helix domain-containing protein n=1 Tax=unclassified Exiguobacterium TaxID=2644629 RepID=UPI001BE66770|nr:MULTISPECIES: helix-turn-helix domain-containing protein [unclassified Exiguobacterium]
MDNYSLGKTISKIRKSRKMSQSELGEWVGGQSIISRIENGLVLPSLDTLLIISNRLDVSIEYLLESLRATNSLQITESKKKLRYLLEHNSYEEALNMSKEERKKFKEDIEYLAYLDWIDAVSEFKLKKIHHQQCVEKLENILNREDTLYADRNLFLYVRSSIATVYLSVGNFKHAIRNYEKIIESEFQYTDDNFKVIVLYNYANALKRNKNYLKGQEITEKAIALAKISGKSVVLGPLYYILGECKEGLNFPDAEVKNCFEKAVEFFKAFDRQDLIEITKIEQNKYFN